MAANRAQRIWAKRPFLLYGFVFVVVCAMLAGLIVDRRVSAYETATLRDENTGVMVGAESRRLGPADAPRAVLMLHGYIGSPNNYADLPDAIAATGWRVEVQRLAGHGTTPRELEKTTAEQMLAEAREALQRLQAHHDTVVLCGHSMGGAIAAILAAEAQPDGLILAAPFFGLTDKTLSPEAMDRLTRFAATFLRWIPRPDDSKPVNRVESKAQIVSYGWVPTRSALEAFALRRMAVQPEVLTQLKMPTLLIHSRNDTVTSADDAATVFGQIPAEVKEAVWLEASDHVIFWDYDDEQVKDATLAFLAQHWPQATADE